MPSLPFRHNDNQTLRYQPTTLKQQGKDEEFLERIIVDNFDVLGLDSLEDGVFGPFVCWQQVPLRTPEGRTIYPDIVAITGSGHFIVVEVKLGNNHELKNRDVISQIIDYASSFSAYSMLELMGALNPGVPENTTWEEFLGSLFPAHSNIQELASVLKRRINDGDLNLVIACDYSPLGTRELLRGVATQSAVGFKLDLIHLTPYIDCSRKQQEILFIPERQITTEIIARTAVTIRIEEGMAVPGIHLETSSIEDIRENLNEPSASSKVWNESRFFAALTESKTGETVAIARQVYDFFVANGCRIAFGKGRITGSVYFMFDNEYGNNYTVALWSNGRIEVPFGQLQNQPSFEDEESRLELLKMLNELKDIELAQDVITKKYPSIEIDYLEEPGELERFLQIMVWMTRRINKS